MIYRFLFQTEHEQSLVQQQPKPFMKGLRKEGGSPYDKDFHEVQQVKIRKKRNVKTEASQGQSSIMASQEKHGKDEVIGTSSFQSFCYKVMDRHMKNQKLHANQFSLHYLPPILLEWSSNVSQIIRSCLIPFIQTQCPGAGMPMVFLSAFVFLLLLFLRSVSKE